MRPLLFVLLASTIGGCAVDAPADDHAAGPHGKDDIWGADDRIERYEIQTDELKQAATSSAAIYIKDQLVADEQTQTYSIASPVSLATDQDLCPGERFAEQPVLAECSGTLIDDDLVITAGHCFDDEVFTCEKYAVVFDFAYDAAGLDPNTPARDIPASKVYACKELVAWEFTDSDNTDYAVFRLDRPVTDRAPAPVNWSAPLEVGTPAYVIGHPAGIPQKLSAAQLLDTVDDTLLHYDADVFGGTSGGGVFDKTGTLIGMHSGSSGRRYEPGPDGTCNVATVCDTETCPASPMAYDTRAVAKRLPTDVKTELGIE
jgi:V8-like Glu-specific endopeptidase